MSDKLLQVKGVSNYEEYYPYIPLFSLWHWHFQVLKRWVAHGRKTESGSEVAERIFERNSAACL